MSKVISRRKAVGLIEDNMTLAMLGFVTLSVPEDLIVSLEERFLEEGHPRNLNVFYTSAIGDGKDHGANRLAHEGLIRRMVGAHVGLAPKLNDLIVNNKLESFCAPQGVLVHLNRAMAGHKCGVITHVGLKTFCDPEVEACCFNDAARKAVAEGRGIVKAIEIDGRRLLHYKVDAPDVCFIKATYGDSKGNLSLEKEGLVLEQFEMAMATKANGGIVIAQVDELIEDNTLDPRNVRVHGHFVDYVVVGRPEYSRQHYFDEKLYHPEWTGEVKVPMDAIAPMKFGLRKIIARRAAMELRKGCLVNLGFGMPDGVASVAGEEGVADEMTLSIESGTLGGVPAPGNGCGASANVEAIVKHPEIFDGYDGGCIDIAYLGAAQIDRYGNVDIRLENGQVNIVKDSDVIKYVADVDQITFSGSYANETGQEVLYITERVVFKLTEQGLTLTEIAPGIDMEKDIFPLMGFKPTVAEDLKLMDARIFKPEKNERFGRESSFGKCIAHGFISASLLGDCNVCCTKIRSEKSACIYCTCRRHSDLWRGVHVRCIICFISVGSGHFQRSKHLPQVGSGNDSGGNIYIYNGCPARFADYSEYYSDKIFWHDRSSGACYGYYCGGIDVCLINDLAGTCQKEI